MYNYFSATTCMGNGQVESGAGKVRWCCLSWPLTCDLRAATQVQVRECHALERLEIACGSAGGVLVCVRDITPGKVGEREYPISMPYDPR